MEKIRHRDEELFYDAILTLKTPADCRAFFEDICTIKELQSIAQRFRVAALLDEGRNYLEVSEETGASSATISPVPELRHRLSENPGQSEEREHCQ